MSLSERERERLRQQSLTQLDILERALQPAVDRGDPEAIRVAARIAADRARMLGVVPPIRVRVTRREDVAGAVTAAVAMELEARARAGMEDEL